MKKFLFQAFFLSQTLFLSQAAWSIDYSTCPVKPELEELMTLDFVINFNGFDEQGRFLIGVNTAESSLVQGRVNGELIDLSIVNQVERNVNDDEVERLVQFNGTILADDGHNIDFYGVGTIFLLGPIADAQWSGAEPEINHYQFYSAHGFRFETDSPTYDFINYLTAIGRETYANNLIGEEVISFQIYAVKECFEGQETQLSGSGLTPIPTEDTGGNGKNKGKGR